MESCILDKISIDSSECHGCGLCAGICPTNALHMKIENGRYLPHFSPKECIDCNKCEKICKDSSFVLEHILEQEEQNNYHPHIGHFSKCHIGYSTNLDIRKKSASGGLVSSLLIHLLNTKKIDGAIVTKLKYNGQNIETYPFIARTEKDILNASSSYYLPVNFSNIIKEIQKQNNGERFAIVALPCVISNLKYAKVNFPFLDKKIVYMFGLFCSNNFNYSVLNFIKNKMNMSNSHDVQYLNFRSEWPEPIISIRTLQKEYRLHPKYWNFLFTLKMYLMCQKCIICKDCCAEHADISFGDAWLPSIKKVDRIGTSICVSRTKKGDELLSLAENSGHIYLTSINSTEVADAQRFALYFKKIQAPWLNKKNEKDVKFIPQLLVTVPITFSLNWFSIRYPFIMAIIPNIIYKLLFYVVAINVVTGYKYIKGEQNEISQKRKL